jgi:hypothetical protein
MPSTSSARVEILPPLNRDGDEIYQLDWLANLMDSQFNIPGTKYRVGLDAFLGLIPGIGDGLGALISFYIVQRLWQFELPWYLRARMVGNIFLDFVIGAIPFAGDLFDVGFKANSANIALAKAHLERRNRRY